MKKYLMLLLFTSLSPCIFANSLEEMMASPEEVIAGNSINDFANIWWQWTYSMPQEVSPIRDLTGENCHQGQSGDVWFLAGGYGSSKIKRTCEIPAGKYIFFPVINMAYWAAKEGALTCEQAKKLAGLNNAQLLSIDIELDSIKASNPAHTRLSSEKCFNIFALAPANAHAYNAYPSASDGYWVMLKPLAKGKHILKFQAKYNREKGAYSKMAQDIEYELNIQ